MTERHYSNKKVEEIADGRLADYQTKFGIITGPPIPIDHIIENLFDLKISWEKIIEKPGEIIWGGLRPQKRQIVLNEIHLDAFQNNPGIERSTKGHELGHWDLFTDQGRLNHPMLPGIDASKGLIFRSASQGQVEVIRLLTTKPEAYKMYKEMIKNEDEPLVKTAVNRYAAALSMPRQFMVPAFKSMVGSWDHWSKMPFNYQLHDLYTLAERFDVSVQALQVRLEQLSLLVIDGKTVYKNKSEANGQLSML